MLGPIRANQVMSIQPHYGSRSAPAQPAQHRRQHSAQYADGGDRPLRLGQVLARLRHHLRRRPAPLRGDALGLCAAVPRPDGAAGRGLHRRAVARDLHRAEDHQPQPALDRRHHHRDLRLPAAAVRLGGPAALPQLRPAHLAADRGPDRRAHRRAGPGRAHHRATRRSCAAARASSARSWRRSTSRASAPASTARWPS